MWWTLLGACHVMDPDGCMQAHLSQLVPSHVILSMDIVDSYGSQGMLRSLDC
jgi:hypothetical protein